MRLFVLLFIMVSVTEAMACSLNVTSETFMGNNGGSACVNISAPKSDARGPFRVMQFDEHSADGQVIPHAAIALRPNQTVVLKAVDVPGIGMMNVITLKALSVSRAVLSFLNGNTLTVTVDENGRVTPGQICVQQSGLSQVRGYPNSCP